LNWIGDGGDDTLFLLPILGHLFFAGRALVGGASTRERERDWLLGPFEMDGEIEF